MQTSKPKGRGGFTINMRTRTPNGAQFGVRAHQALGGLFSKFTNKAWRGESGSANKRLFTVNVTQKRRLEGCALPSARMVS